MDLSRIFLRRLQIPKCWSVHHHYVSLSTVHLIVWLLSVWLVWSLLVAVNVFRVRLMFNCHTSLSGFYPWCSHCDQFFIQSSNPDAGHWHWPSIFGHVNSNLHLGSNSKEKWVMTKSNGILVPNCNKKLTYMCNVENNKRPHGTHSQHTWNVFDIQQTMNKWMTGDGWWPDQ